MNAAAFWIAAGESYLKEAEKSAESLRRHMPEVQRVLITPGVYMEKKRPIFDQICGMSNPDRKVPWHAFSIACCEWAAHNLQVPLLDPAPDVLIKLDVDIFVVEPFNDLLEVLERFDIVGTHAPARRTGRTVGRIPDAFSELNLGMLAFRNSDKMTRVIEEWHRRYRRHWNLYGDTDQASLRETLWMTGEDVRIWVAPPEYQFRFPFGGFVSYPVKLLHGRSKRSSIEEVARRVNSPLGMRAWKKGEL